MSVHTTPRKVLMVSFRFPPHGGGGVQRIAYFTKYLPAYGWSPHVLTSPIGDYIRVRDNSLLNVIPRDVPVSRTGYFDSRRVFRALGKLHLARLARTFSPSFPSMYGGWILHAYKAGIELLKRERFDLIYSSAYPLSSHIVGYLLKKKTGLPWVADYRDEWSLRSVAKWPTGLHRALGLWLDRLLIGAADRVVTTSPAHTAIFARTFGPDDGKYRTVTNGYEEADFDSRDSEITDTTRDTFLISHVGSLFPWRTADSFLAAVRYLVDVGRIPADRIRVSFVGVGCRPDISGLERQGIVRRLGYVSHGEAVAWMKASDVLLLINTECTNIPGKTFEYLASGRPILAAVRPGPTADIVRRARAGLVVDPDDWGRIACALERLYSDWCAGKLVSTADRGAIRRYTRRETARQLVEVFEDVTLHAGVIQERAYIPPVLEDPRRKEVLTPGAVGQTNSWADN
jgi:glycosyltransferase involved in cell wall biosynthesis